MIIHSKHYGRVHSWDQVVFFVYLRTTDKCSECLKTLLNNRYAELEEMRNAIIDGYRYEDLFLKWDEVDDEEALIRLLLKHLKNDAEKLKAEKQQKWRDA